MAYGIRHPCTVFRSLSGRPLSPAALDLCHRTKESWLRPLGLGTTRKDTSNSIDSKAHQVFLGTRLLKFSHDYFQLNSNDKDFHLNPNDKSRRNITTRESASLYADIFHVKADKDFGCIDHQHMVWFLINLSRGFH